MEKIIVNPERVRCYGNIMMEHTVDDYTLVGSSILVDTDTVMGAETTVYSIEAESSTLSVVLSSSVGSCSIGDTVTLSATVLDDEEPVEGGTVTFKLNTTTLGTDETDSSGEASYTYTTSSVGSLNFTAYYESHNSNTVSVVVSHDYSIAFDSSSYSTSDGNVTAYVTLLDNSNPISGASISLTGTGSTLSATTNSSGVATFNLTGISSDCTLTATYDNVSDTATVTVSTGPLFYDDCSSASGLSNYGTLHKLRTNSVDGTLSYDSGMNAYKILPTTANNDGFCDFPILALDNKNNYYVECEIYTTDTTTGGQPGLTVYPTTSTGGEGVFYRDIASINRCGVLKFANWSENGESGNSQKSSLPVGNNWIKVRIEVNGTSVKGIWLKTDDTEIYTHTYTVPYTSSQMRVGITVLLKSTSKPYYIRNIEADYL